MGLPVKKLMLGVAAAMVLTGAAQAQLRPVADVRLGAESGEDSPLTASRMFQVSLMKRPSSLSRCVRPTSGSSRTEENGMPR